VIGVSERKKGSFGKKKSKHNLSHKAQTGEKPGDGRRLLFKRVRESPPAKVGGLSFGRCPEKT